jgi:hypothetical protein
MGWSKGAFGDSRRGPAELAADRGPVPVDAHAGQRSAEQASAAPAQGIGACAGAFRPLRSRHKGNRVPCCPGPLRRLAVTRQRAVPRVEWSRPSRGVEAEVALRRTFPQSVVPVARRSERCPA